MPARDWTPHPGEYIKEEIEARGWKQRDLAYILGCPEQSITLIINGKRGISPKMSKALANALGVDSDLFMNLQRAYDLVHAAEPSPEIEKRAKLAKYPIRNMIKRGWLTDEPNTIEPQMIRFFDGKLDEFSQKNDLINDK